MTSLHMPNVQMILEPGLGRQSYVDWLDRLAKSQGEDWKKQGIYNLIMLFRQDIPINTALMYSFLGFWAISINGFIFPFATMSSTLLDVAAITRLSVKGKRLPAFFSLSVGDLGIQFSKSNASYLAFLAINAKGQ